MGGYIAAFVGGLVLGCLVGIFTMCLCIVGDYEDPYLEESEWDGDREDSSSEKE